MALMLPREGFGFSRDAAVAFGPPRFGKAAFAVGEVTRSTAADPHALPAARWPATDRRQRDPAGRAPGRPLAPFRYPTFRAIWIANLFSSIGGMIQSVGAAWLMTELTQIAPADRAGPGLGDDPDHAAGRVRRRDRRQLRPPPGDAGRRRSACWRSPRALARADLGRADRAAVCCSPSPSRSGAGTALNAPAWQASVRAQVAPEDLPQAISLNSISFNLARSVGPALGGLLISLWSTELAFALNALSYLGDDRRAAALAGAARQSPARTPMLPRDPRRAALLREFARRSARCCCAASSSGSARRATRRCCPRSRATGCTATELDFGLMLGVFGVGSIVAALFVGGLAAALRGRGGARRRRRWPSSRRSC